MKNEALLKKVRGATSEERKLIAQILEAPKPFQDFLSETLSEVKKKRAVKDFVEAIVDLVAEVSKEVPINRVLSGESPFEKVVDILTGKEALDKLVPSDPLAVARLRGLLVKRELLYRDCQPLKSEEVASLLGRFDTADQGYGILYAGEDLYAAFGPSAATTDR